MSHHAREASTERENDATRWHAAATFAASWPEYVPSELVRLQSERDTAHAALVACGFLAWLLTVCRPLRCDSCGVADGGDRVADGEGAFWSDAVRVVVTCERCAT